MKTALRLVALLGALVLAAASGSSSSSSKGSSSGTSGSSGSNNNIVSATITVDDESPVVPALANGAGIGGCQVAHNQSEPNKMAAKCQNGTIAIIQEGKNITFGCPDINLEQCKAVFRYILDKTPTN